MVLNAGARSLRAWALSINHMWGSELSPIISINQRHNEFWKVSILFHSTLLQAPLRLLQVLFVPHAELQGQGKVEVRWAVAQVFWLATSSCCFSQLRIKVRAGVWGGGEGPGLPHIPETCWVVLFLCGNSSGRGGGAVREMWFSYLRTALIVFNLSMVILLVLWVKWFPCHRDDIILPKQIEDSNLFVCMQSSYYCAFTMSTQCYLECNEWATLDLHRLLNRASCDPPVPQLGGPKLYGRLSSGHSNISGPNPWNLYMLPYKGKVPLHMWLSSLKWRDYRELSRWILNANAKVLREREKQIWYRPKRRQYDHRGRYWSDVATSHQMPGSQ